ncbi:MAG: hypothetical protein QXI91_04420 [Candidatus Bathyarchaeia archaeon]
MHEPIAIILLLGSYDSETKLQLENLKEEIAKSFSGEDVYAFLLDNVEIYYSDIVQLLAELLNETKATFFIFENDRLVDVYDVDVKNGLDETVYAFLKEKYGVKKINKPPIFEKFTILMRLAKAIFLIRHKEETRCGEYLELMHALFSGHSEKVWFFKRNGLQLLAMLMEYMDKFKVNMRTYNNGKSLTTAVTRVLKYSLS